MPSEDTKFQTLYDHYKDTFTHIKDYLKRRDRGIFYVLLVVTLMLFQLISPKNSGEVISRFIVKQLELESPVDASFIDTIIWFSLLVLVVRYFQLVVLLERQYEYIHKLEEAISSNYTDSNEVFTRESKSYLRNYPLISNWTSALYTIVFPIFLLTIIIIKIFGEVASAGAVSTPLVFNIVIFLFTLVSTVLYLFLVHFRK